MFNFDHSPSFAYSILICLIIIERIGELFYSKKNEKRLLERGALEFGKKTYILIVIYQVTWILTCLIGDFSISNQTNFIQIFIGFILLIFAKHYGSLVLRPSKSRWTTKIIVLPNEPLIQKGIYKYIKHPNYLGVILESFALPLIGGLWELSFVFGILSIFVMSLKTRIEESALIKYCGYDKLFGRDIKSDQVCQ
ncbi:MAG: isoprenylcysteine carboxylmethyltransferase family protein [Bacteriovoracaceae bacterium]